MIWFYIVGAISLFLVLAALYEGYARPSSDDDDGDGYTFRQRLWSGTTLGAFAAVVCSIVGILIVLGLSLISGALIEDEKSDVYWDLVSVGGTYVSIRPEGEYNTPHYSYFLPEGGSSKNYSVSTDRARIEFSDGPPKLIGKQVCTDPFWEFKMGCDVKSYVIRIPEGSSVPQSS